MSKGTQVNVTKNQSTFLIEQKHVFLFDNKYDETIFNNTTASAEVTLTSGMLMFKLSATEVDVLAAAASIAAVVGIAAMDNDAVVADAGTQDINICIGGGIAEEGIVLPGGITLDTVIPTTQLTLRDRLNELGFHISSAGMEHTKFDNN